MIPVRIFFVVLLLAPVFSYSQRCDSVAWSKHHHLKWKYFKSRPDRSNPATALSEIKIRQVFSVSGHTGTLTVSCSFSTCSSWTKNKNSRNLLAHEQTHFALGEYYKRLLVKEIMDQHFSVQDAPARIMAAGLEMNRRRKEENDRYDIETNHSMNPDQQKEWTKRVNKMLRKLSKYDKATYTFALAGS
jgi:hypothetical protein